MKNTQTKLILLWFMAIAMAILVGCNSYPSKDEPTPTGSTYQIAGVTVIDPNRDTTIVLGTILKDSLPMDSATLVFGLDSLRYSPTPFTSDSVYARMFTVANRYAGGGYQIVFTDPTVYADTDLVIVPGGFTLTNVTPPNRLVNGDESVSLDWSGAANASTYVVSAVQRNLRYTGQGFSQYSASGITAATFERDAFYPTGGPLPDTGWYYLYVYALTGSPDSALSTTALPVPLPSQLTDNISGKSTVGHWGVVRVLLRDSVQVVSQP